MATSWLVLTAQCSLGAEEKISTMWPACAEVELHLLCALGVLVLVLSNLWESLLLLSLLLGLREVGQRGAEAGCTPGQTSTPMWGGWEVGSHTGGQFGVSFGDNEWLSYVPVLSVGPSNPSHSSLWLPGLSKSPPSLHVPWLPVPAPENRTKNYVDSFRERI